MNIGQRVQRNPVLLLAVGAALIVVAIALVWVNISTRRAPATSATSQTNSAQSAIQGILVTTHAIVRGTVIGSDDVALRGVSTPVPADSFTNPAAVVGRVAVVDMLPSQIVFGSALSASKEAAGVSALVQNGERAFAIKVSEDEIVGGFLRVDDHVDVFVTLPGSIFAQKVSTEGKSADESRASLLLQNVTVLAVGEKLATKGPDAVNGVRTVTLAVTPDAIARLALADRLGKLMLAIRNPSDNDVAAANTVDLADLGTLSTDVGQKTADAAPAKENAAGGHRIIIYSGANTTSVTTSR